MVSEDRHGSPSVRADLLLAGLFITAAGVIFLIAWMLSTPAGVGRHPAKPRLETSGLLIPVSREWAIPCVAWRPNQTAQWRLHCSPTAVYRGSPVDE